MLTAIPKIALVAPVPFGIRVVLSTKLGRFYSVQTRAPKSKVWSSADEAVRDVKSGDTLLCGGEWIKLAER